MGEGKEEQGVTPEIIDISKLKPKEQVVQLLIQANPTASKSEIARKAKQLGIYKNEGSARLLIQKGKPLDAFKKQVNQFIESNVVAPALEIHADKLESIKSKDIDNVNEVDMKAVYEAEKLRPQQVDVNIPEVIKVAHIHKVLSDIDNADID